MPVLLYYNNEFKTVNLSLSSFTENLIQNMLIAAHLV